MNIFVLDNDPRVAAQMMCDRHVVKMVIESAQMLSTAHRMLDGHLILEPSKSGKRNVKRWVLDDQDLDNNLYKAVHMNHPCSIWTRECSANYLWHYQHFVALCDEYQYRYCRTHLTDRKLRTDLSRLPVNIPYSKTTTPMRMAMFEDCKVSDDPVECYRNYYQTKQSRFSMHWTGRKVPHWFRFYNEEYVL